MTIENKVPHIELRSIKKIYDKNPVLDNVSFKIEKGTVFGYIGPNGAGKTTTMKIIVGLIHDYDGCVLINGTNVKNEDVAFHKSLGYLPQESGFQQWRTIDQALKTFGKLSGLETEHLETRIQEVLETVGLTEVRYKKIKFLSGGMVQKLRLAQALLHEPDFLILDEPLSGLDPSIRFQVNNIIKSLARKGTTIFISSHILSDIQNIADVIGILNFGHLVKVGTPAELQREFHIGNVIKIEFSEGSALCNGLESFSNVEKVEIVKDNIQRVHLKSEVDIDSTIREILKKIADQNCRLRSFLLERPSLEDVYMKYVGGVSS